MPELVFGKGRWQKGQQSLHRPARSLAGGSDRAFSLAAEHGRELQGVSPACVPRATTDRLQMWPGFTQPLLTLLQGYNKAQAPQATPGLAEREQGLRRDITVQGYKLYWCCPLQEVHRSE